MGDDIDDLDLGGKRKAAGGGDAKRKNALEKKLEPLRGAIEYELKFPTKRGWTGNGIVLGGKPFQKVSADTKKDIQAIGLLNGCHQCGGQAEAAWIVDHIPPRSLKRKDFVISKAYRGVKWNGFYYFYPHCSACAETQAALVGRLNRAKRRADCKKIVEGLSRDEKILIYKTGRFAGYCVRGHGNKPQNSDRADIQRIGTDRGCHSCPEKWPSKKFNADHNPPVAFKTDFMLRAIDILGLEMPEVEVRPHCKSCSNKQGGRIKDLVDEVEVIVGSYRN